jgi:hypothetical protein
MKKFSLSVFEISPCDDRIVDCRMKALTMKKKYLNVVGDQSMVE